MYKLHLLLAMALVMTEVLSTSIRGIPTEETTLDQDSTTVSDAGIKQSSGAEESLYETVNEERMRPVVPNVEMVRDVVISLPHFEAANGLHKEESQSLFSKGVRWLASKRTRAEQTKQTAASKALKPRVQTAIALIEAGKADRVLYAANVTPQTYWEALRLKGTSGIIDTFMTYVKYLRYSLVFNQYLEKDAALLTDEKRMKTVSSQIRGLLSPNKKLHAPSSIID